METKGWRREEERLEIAIFSIHILDRIRWVAGLVPDSMSALTRKSWQADAPRGEVFADLRIAFENGAIGHMTSSWFSHEQECKLRVDGKLGSLVTSRTSATASEAHASITSQDGHCRKEHFHREDAGRKAFGYSLKHLLDAIDEDLRYQVCHPYRRRQF
jgi:predicted dehydrogenase